MVQLQTVKKRLRPPVELPGESGQSSRQTEAVHLHTVDESVEPLRYIAILTGKVDLATLLEVIVGVTLFKQNHRNTVAVAYSHPDHASFLEQSGLFYSVIVPGTEDSLVSMVRKESPGVIHLPFQGSVLSLALRSVRCPVRIGGSRGSRMHRFLGYLDPERQADQITLSEKGYASTDSLDMRMDIRPPANLDGRKYIWLNLWDLRKSRLKWSTGHAARLGRLLQKEGIFLVIPYCHTSYDDRTFDEDLEYLRTASPDTILYESCRAEDRCAGMAGAMAVVGPHSSEMTLAQFLGAPALVLETAGQTSARKKETPPDDHDDEAVQLPFGGRFQFATSRQNFLSSGKDDPCGEGCGQCSDGPCIDLISPETVFESLKHQVSWLR